VVCGDMRDAASDNAFDFVRFVPLHVGYESIAHGNQKDSQPSSTTFNASYVFLSLAINKIARIYNYYLHAPS